MEQDIEDSPDKVKQDETNTDKTEASPTIAKDNNNEKSVTIVTQPSAVSSNQSSDGNNELDSSLISNEASEDKPSSNFFMAILVTLICPGAQICGIVAILCGFKVKSQLNHGDIEGAKRSSRFGRLWINGGYLTTCAILVGVLIASVTYELYRLFAGIE